MKYSDLKHDLLLLPHEQRSRLLSLKNTDNIVGNSGGKDSLATCILLHWLEIPFRTITAEVWWKEGISGENPYHFEFMQDTVYPKLKSWGVEYNIVRSDITAFRYMTTPIVRSKKHPDRIGKLRGFPLCGACGIQRDCKARPCERFYKKQGDHVGILGFASDEKDRILTKAAKNKISVLNLFDVAEYQTYGICAQDGLLSPTYSFSCRGGCWFCPNQKIQELELTYRCFPHLWGELMYVQKLPNKVQENFNRTQTLYDIERQIKNGVQQKWFIGNLIDMKGNKDA